MFHLPHYTTLITTPTELPGSRVNPLKNSAFSSSTNYIKPQPVYLTENTHTTRRTNQLMLSSVSITWQAVWTKWGVTLTSQVVQILTNRGSCRISSFLPSIAFVVYIPPDISGCPILQGVPQGHPLLGHKERSLFRSCACSNIALVSAVSAVSLCSARWLVATSYATVKCQWLGVLYIRALTLSRRSADCFIYRPSPYRAVNTLRLGYKNQSVNVV